MRNYILARDQRVLVFEIPFTRDEKCDQALQCVMDSFLDESSMREIPAVQTYLRSHPGVEAELFALLRRIISGYTYWRAIGVFGNTPEASGVLRIIVHDTMRNGGLSPDMERVAREVVIHLICKRLAVEFDDQDAVWCMEYPAVIHVFYDANAGQHPSPLAPTPAVPVGPSPCRCFNVTSSGLQLCM